MPNLKSLSESGSASTVQHAFPCVTWPSQANLLTGKPAAQHGVVANGFFWREDRRVEMWTAWNEVIQQPQLWDTLKDRGKYSAAWFPMLSKGCGADYVCMPAPIHKPDGSEDLWCYTKPQEFYGQLLEKYGHFPLQHFWGPLANIKSSRWIAESAIECAKKFQPDFFYIYLPHLDYAAQKFGPNSEEANQAVIDLDELLGGLLVQMNDALESPSWMVHSEYVITEVDHVSYPNRVLREAGLLQVCEFETDPGKEQLDFTLSSAWALVDHQFAHVFVKDRDANVIQQVAELFVGIDGIESVLVGSGRGSLDHERSGDVILVSARNSWQAYYWWQDDEKAPAFARTVDIHRKPGYDPVELCFDMATKSVPLDASIIKGSHGLPQAAGQEQGVLVCSESGLIDSETVTENQIYFKVLDFFAT
jgi:hypothetical protein